MQKSLRLSAMLHHDYMYTHSASFLFFCLNDGGKGKEYLQTSQAFPKNIDTFASSETIIAA